MSLRGRRGIEAYLRSRVGDVVEKEELFAASGYQTSFTRRIRELRTEYGYRIESHLDAVDLRPGQYRLVELPLAEPDPNLSRQISQRVRAQVLALDDSQCRRCGRGVGDRHEDGQNVVLHVDHIVSKAEGGTDEVSNLRTLCSRCNQGGKDIVAPPESQMRLLGRVRTASRNDQRAVYEWLREKFEK